MSCQPLGTLFRQLSCQLSSRQKQKKIYIEMGDQNISVDTKDVRADEAENMEVDEYNLDRSMEERCG